MERMLGHHRAWITRLLVTLASVLLVGTSLLAGFPAVAEAATPTPNPGDLYHGRPYRGGIIN